MEGSNRIFGGKKETCPGGCLEDVRFLLGEFVFLLPFFVDRKEDFFHGKIELEIVSIM